MSIVFFFFDLWLSVCGFFFFSFKIDMYNSMLLNWGEKAIYGTLERNQTSLLNQEQC